MMKAQKDAEEITRILAEAPSARKALLDNYDNLSNVAKYCEDNYFQAGSDSSKALEETKAFTTQSLASVAYQISSLATNVLRLLEAQTSQLRRIESSVHLIGLTVDMHREKVARREIGVFTMTKRCSRSNKVIPPPGGKEPKPKYTRNPISYSSLDSLGHSMKDAKPQERKATMMRKQGGTLGRRNSRPAEPVQCPVAPSLSRGASQTSLSDKMTTSSFGKAVSPPVVPNWPTSPDTDIVSTLLENGSPAPPLLGNGPPAPAMLDEVGPEPKLNIPPAPPPHFAPCDLLPPPPMPPAEENFEASDLGSIAPPPPAPLLETVPEENSLPLPECLPPPIIDVLQIPTPPPHFAEEHGDARRSRRSRARQPPPSSRSMSLRVRAGPSTRSLYSRSLLLPQAQSHLEIPALSPPPFMDCLDGFEDLPPLPPPVDYDTSTPAEYLEEVVALYSYDTGKPGDLAFQVGDVIYLTRRNEDGWCEGVLNGLAGFFPGNYVERTS